MHNNAHVVGVIVIENYKEKTIKRAYMNLVDTIARLFGTSMHLQKTIELAEELIADESVTLEGYQKVAEEDLHKFAVSNLVYQFFSLILEPNNQNNVKHVSK